jgi:hypothetical protein
MGKLTPGMLGTASGKVGDVTVVTVKGVTTIRKNRKKSTSTSEDQKVQRAKFGFVQQSLNPVSDLLQITFPKKGIVTGLNNATSDTFADAVVGDYPDFSIDYTVLKVAKGKLEEPKSAAVSQVGTNLEFTWTPNADEGNAAVTDKVVLVAICPALKKSKYTIGAADRTVGRATLDVTKFLGQTVHTYVAFITHNKRKASDSMYTGVVELVIVNQG